MSTLPRNDRKIDITKISYILENMTKSRPKLITILGPTASGKSSLGIELAQEFNGEIVSADSRQVFRGLDIGSGKVTKEEQKMAPHHLLDIADPMEEFSVAHFQKLAFDAIDNIISDGKIPLLVGGTALYIYSVIDNYKFTDVPANPKRRKELEGKTVEELLVIASECTHERGNPVTNAQSNDDEIASVANTLPRNDKNNPRRIIRAIEKIEAGVPITPEKGPQKYENIIFGINFPRKELYKRIDLRVDQRLKEGMIEEVEKLRKNGVKDEWLIQLGLEYRSITEYLQGKNSKEEMVEKLKNAIHAFSKRQMTWFNKDKRIIWVKNKQEASKKIEAAI